MNQHSKLEPETSAREFLRRQRPTVSVYARELFEAAVAAEADWDSIRAPYRQKRLEDAWKDMQRVMEQ
jgi:hypothetical protein